MLAFGTTIIRCLNMFDGHKTASKTIVEWKNTSVLHLVCSSRPARGNRTQ